jgi:hypothetical protein
VAVVVVFRRGCCFCGAKSNMWSGSVHAKKKKGRGKDCVLNIVIFSSKMVSSWL